MRDLGFTVRVKLLAWHEPSDWVAGKALLRNGFKVSIAKFEDTCANIRWLLSEMRESPPDVLIANHILPAYYAAKYLKQSGIPTIGVLRSDHSYYNGIVDRFVIGRSSDRISGIVCVSEFLEQGISKKSPQKSSSYEESHQEPFCLQKSPVRLEDT